MFHRYHSHISHIYRNITYAYLQKTFVIYYCVKNFYNRFFVKVFMELGIFATFLWLKWHGSYLLV